MGGAMVLTVALIITKIVGAIYKVPQTAILEGYGLGVYGYAHGFYLMIYAVVATGFPSAISKIIVGYTREGRYNDIKRTVRIANIFFVIVGVAGSLILFLFAKPYSEHVLHDANIYYAIVAVAPSIVFSCLMCTHRGYNQGMHNMTPTAVTNVVEVIVKCAVGLTAAYIVKAHFMHEFLNSGTVMGVAYDGIEAANVPILALTAAASIFGVTVSTFAGWLYLVLRRRMKGDNITDEQYANSPAARADRYLLKQILLVGLPVSLGAIATTLTSEVNSVIIQRQLERIAAADPLTLFASHKGHLESEVSLYTDPGVIATFLSGCSKYSSSFFTLIGAITGSFNMSALPYVADAWLVRDRKAVKEHVDITLKTTMLIAAPLGFGLVALGTPLLHLLFSRTPSEVAIGGPILSLLGFAAILLSLYSVSNTMLQAIGRFDLPVKLLAAGGVINILITYLLVGIPSLNIKVMPVGMIVSYLFIAVLSLYYLAKNTRIRFDYVGVLAKPLLAGILCGLTAYIVYELQILFLYDVIRQKIATVIAIIVAAVVYLVAISLLRVVKKEDVLSMPKGEKILIILEKLRIVR